MENDTTCQTAGQTNIHNERVVAVGIWDNRPDGFMTEDDSGIGRVYEGNPPKEWPIDLRLDAPGAEDH